MTEVRIIDVTPPRGPADLTIWQIETRPSDALPWHRDQSGQHTSTDYDKLAEIAREIDPAFEA